MSSEASGSSPALQIELAADGALKTALAALNTEDPAQISRAAIAKLLTSAVKLYAFKSEMEDDTFFPFTNEETVTPTEVVRVVSAMLKAVDLNVFDLSMWILQTGDN
jgi:hypothetical protein